MDLDLRVIRATPAADRYAQGLARALGDQGIGVHIGSGLRPWWQGRRGHTIAIGAPPSSRQLGRADHIDGWIWLEGSADQAAAIGREHPARRVAVAELVGTSNTQSDTCSIPYPVANNFFAPGDGTEIFQVTKRLHLEQRPRIVLAGPYLDGRGLTLALHAMKTILARGGELVWLDALHLRPQFAPVVERLRLMDRVVFLPPLPDMEIAAVLLGSDLALLPERMDTFPYWLPWCHAAGLPAVVMDTPVARLAVGSAALLVNGEREDGLENAIRAVLTDAAIQRQLIARGVKQGEQYRDANVASAFIQWMESAMPTA